MDTEVYDQNYVADEDICKDYDEDCVLVPGITPDGSIRSHLTCWMHDPSCGVCPFLIKDKHRSS